MLIHSVPHAIYAIIDPRDGTVVYVGCTANFEVRCKQHCGAPASKPIGRFMVELMLAGLEPQFKILETVVGFGYCERERYWIAYYKAIAGDRSLNRKPKRGRFDKPSRYEMETA